MIPETISHYRIISKLGEGGMGEVYLAEDTRLRRKVALKILPADLTQDADRLARFKQEAQTASALNHPNILTIYEVEEINGLHFIATEFIEGETLRQHMEHRRMQPNEVVETALQVAGALSAAHAAGIIHRDIKPENIMLRPDGYIKILDFGLAKLAERKSRSADTSLKTVTRVETETGIVMGTVRYMSPEQARGQPLDARSDIFSLGIVIYELLAGSAPFQGETTADLFVSILANEPSPLSYTFTDIPPQLERIVLKCLEKDREGRYASANELLVDLKGLASPASGEYSAAAKTSVSIAVLPFVNMSADPENEYFCDGLAEELLNSLAKIDALRVAARTSAFSFKHKQTDIGEIGRKLKVVTVLEGSVRKAGNRLRIMAQLINVADGYHIWSERYDREMQDIFDVQDEISLAIVDALKVKLLGTEKAAVLKRFTDNTEAYQLYLKGRHHYGKHTELGFREAIECFEQAIAKEPDYALALAGVVLSYLRLWWYGYISPAEGEAKWKPAAARAMELDSDLAESHLIHALLSFHCELDFPRARLEFERALDLNPNYAQASEQYSLLLAMTGTPQEALAVASGALELDPVSLVTNLNIGWVYWFIGEYDRMADQARKLIEMEPGFFGGHWLLGVQAWTRGLYEEAILEFQTATSLGGTIVLSGLGCIYGIAGEREKAQQILDQLLEMSTRRYVRLHDIALVYAGLGEHDLAFGLLEQACQQRESRLVIIKYVGRIIPGFSSDPRMADLLRRIGLPE